MRRTRREADCSAALRRPPARGGARPPRAPALFVLLALLGLAFAMAPAGEPSPLDRATDLYWEGRFADAVAALEPLAASLEGEQRLLAEEYLARSLIRLGEEERGRAAFKSLLRSNPDWRPDPKEASGPEVAAFEAALAAFENENLGAVSVRTDPTRANVFLDGALQKEPTPVTLERVPAGEHAIRVEREGCAPFDTTMTIAAGEIAALDVVLEAAEGPAPAVPFWKRTWVRIAAGGFVGAGVLLALAGGGGDGGDETPGDLPGFPEPPHQ